MDATHVIGAIAEVFTWAGLGIGLVVAVAAVVVRLADGTWTPVRAFVLPDADPPVVRWFGRGHEIGEAPLTPELAEAAQGDELDAFTRLDRPGSVRLHARSPWVRLLGWSALGFGALALVSSVLQLVLVAIA